jgi:hypothetical protein
MVDERESELELSGLLSALSFGASFEELANFLIDRIDVHYAAPSRGHTPPTALRLLSFPERLSALNRASRAPHWGRIAGRMAAGF